MGLFSSPAFFEALDPHLKDVIADKMREDIYPIGAKAGELTERAAAWMGLNPGIPVAVANMDAHVSVPGSSVTHPGRMVMIMGISTCHIFLGDSKQPVEGICGVVEEGVVPDLFGYEAGQSGVGDTFGWFVEHAVPPEYHEEAKARGISVHKLLEEKAAAQKPGEHSLLALDWWNGNRSVLVDGDLSGVLVGAALGTRVEDIYRALIESTAYGTRVIIEAFEQNGIAINEIVASGSLPERNPMMMQIYADITGREFRLAGSHLAGALGSVLFGAVVAGAERGGYDTVEEAAEHMTHLQDKIYQPIRENQAVYDQLYAEYFKLYEYFGRGGNPVMKILKAIRNRAIA
jgi:L-ribulokinase